jgi:hypothetical protein
MAWLALLLIVVAFGGMALALCRSERAEERRILARAEAILAHGSVVVDLPAEVDNPDRGAPAGHPAPAGAGRGQAVAPRAPSAA